MKVKVIPLSKFDRWLNSERRKGLADFKLSLKPNSGASLHQIQEEILHLESKVLSGDNLSLPVATVFLPPQILALINSVKLPSR